MIGAVIDNNIVENVIILNESQIDHFSKVLQREIIDARPYGLAIGDLRTTVGWTRNADGEQIILPLLGPKDYSSYAIAATKVAILEKQQETIAEISANEATTEAIGILSGEVEA